MLRPSTSLSRVLFLDVRPFLARAAARLRLSVRQCMLLVVLVALVLLVGNLRHRWRLNRLSALYAREMAARHRAEAKTYSQSVKLLSEQIKVKQALLAGRDPADSAWTVRSISDNQRQIEDLQIRETACLRTAKSLDEAARVALERW
jgi:hypothetical protein